MKSIVSVLEDKALLLDAIGQSGPPPTQLSKTQRRTHKHSLRNGACTCGDNQRQKLRAERGSILHVFLVFGSGGADWSVCRDGGAEIEESLRWRVVQIVSQCDGKAAA